MDKTREPNDVEDAEMTDLERKIGEMRSIKKALFEKARPINEELETIAQCEREFVDKLQRLRAEKHDREKQRQTIQPLVELESELEREKCENVRLSDRITDLERSLDEATKYSKAQLQKISELESSITAAEKELASAKASDHMRSDVVDNTAINDVEKQLNVTAELLNKTEEELGKTRQRLSDVQERLTVAEQVTAATQQRALQQSDNSDQLLQLQLTLQHQPTARAGYVLICDYVD